MNWKKFFLDWRKIVIFIIFVLLSYFIFAKESSGGCAGMPQEESVSPKDMKCIWTSNSCPIMGYKLFVPLWPISVIHECAYYGEVSLFVEILSSNLPVNLFFSISGILNIVYWYLLSCLIIWIYDKVRKKWKKKK